MRAANQLVIETSHVRYTFRELVRSYRGCSVRLPSNGTSLLTNPIRDSQRPSIINDHHAWRDETPVRDFFLYTNQGPHREEELKSI
jgi:hypothetical protein